MSHFAGDILRERREAMDLRLQDVAARVHVPMAYLRAFEAGDLDALPAPAYSVGFLQSYCKLLELEPEPFLDRYRLCMHRNSARAIRSPFLLNLFGGGGEKPRWMEELQTWTAICAVLILGWVTYATLTRPIVERAETQVDAGTVEIAPPFDFGKSE
jgi:cytoskeletal protein RodZ